MFGTRSRAPATLRQDADPRTTAQTQGRNIRHYANYLSERARAYRDTKIDWVRGRESRMDTVSVEKGLLRETEAIQNQLTALLKCDVRGPGATFWRFFFFFADSKLGYGQRARERNNNYGLQAVGAGSSSPVPGAQPGTHQHPR